MGNRNQLKQLSTSNIFTFITTHDFELCELENQGTMYRIIILVNIMKIIKSSLII